jgi:hypothetical protein
MTTRNGTYTTPISRPLTVYAFDPNLGRRLNNYMTIKIGYEPLEPGPVGRKLAVIDYDISNDCYYEAIDLDNSFVLMRNGLEPSEADPRFHQQMVYAVASETLRRFELALGREVKWRCPPTGRTHTSWWIAACTSAGTWDDARHRRDIAAQTGKRLALVIASHAHQDHVSGFGKQKALFQQFSVN